MFPEANTPEEVLNNGVKPIQPSIDLTCRLLKFIGARVLYSLFLTILRGIDFGYVHLANMSQWGDSEVRISPRVFAASTGGVLMSHHTLIVLEGNIPRKEYIVNSYKYYDVLKTAGLPLSPTSPAIPTSSSSTSPPAIPAPNILASSIP